MSTPAADPLLALSEAVGMLRAGSRPDQVWERLDWGPVSEGVPRVPGDAQVAVAVRAACELAHRTGAPLSTVLEVIIDHAGQYAEAQSAAKVALEGPRVSATVLQWLPLAGLGLAAIIDPGAARILVATPLGWLLLGVAGTLTWAGRRWMRSMVRRALDAGQASGNEGQTHSDSPSGGSARDVTREQAVAPLLVMGLADAALAAGGDVVSVLDNVGAVMHNNQGSALRDIAARLRASGDWEQVWRHAPADLEPLEKALRQGWLHGMDPGLMFDMTVSQLRRQQRTEIQEAVAGLSVSLTFPLTMCFLPAFALVGVVPMVVAVAQTAVITLA